MKTTRADLVAEASRNVKVSKEALSVALQAMLEVIMEEVVAGRRIEIRGFGSFWSKSKRATRAYDFRRRTHVPVPARRVAKFKPSIDLVLLMREARRAAA